MVADQETEKPLTTKSKIAPRKRGDAEEIGESTEPKRTKPFTAKDAKGAKEIGRQNLTAD